MEVTAQTIRDTQVVAIVGEIDGSSAPQAQARIMALIQPTTRVILDMSRVAYMSSAGLRMLLLLYRTIHGKGGKVALVGLSPELLDTMSMTGFLDFFSHFDSVETGIAQLA